MAFAVSCTCSISDYLVPTLIMSVLGRRLTWTSWRAFVPRCPLDSTTVSPCQCSYCVHCLIMRSSVLRHDRLRFVREESAHQQVVIGAAGLCEERASAGRGGCSSCRCVGWLCGGRVAEQQECGGLRLLHDGCTSLCPLRCHSHRECVQCNSCGPGC